MRSARVGRLSPPRVRTSRAELRVLAPIVGLISLVTCGGDVVETPGGSLGYGEVVRVGSLDGLDAFPAMPMDLLVTGGGDLVILTAGQGASSLPFVYDSAGVFLRRLGGSGEGPGEFTAAMVGWSLPGDSLLIHDLRQSRATVFDSRGEVGRIIQIGGQVTELIPVSWPDTVLAVMWPQGRPGQWYRLVSLEGSEAETLREFGSPFPTDFQVMVQMRRYASVDETGEIWTIDNRSYELRRWTSSGDSAGVVQPRSEWFATPGQGFGPDSTPPTNIVAVQHLGGDTVAVGLNVARAGWEAAWIGVDLSGPEVRPPEASDLWEGVVEFRRASDGTLIGSQRLEGVIFTMLPDSRVATHRSEGPGYPVVSVYARERQGPPGGR